MIFLLIIQGHYSPMTITLSCTPMYNLRWWLAHGVFNKYLWMSGWKESKYSFKLPGHESSCSEWSILFTMTTPPLYPPQKNPNNQVPPTKTPTPNLLRTYHILKVYVLYQLLQKYVTKPEPHSYVVFMYTHTKHYCPLWRLFTLKSALCVPVLGYRVSGGTGVSFPVLTHSHRWP